MDRTGKSQYMSYLQRQQKSGKKSFPTTLSNTMEIYPTAMTLLCEIKTIIYK